MQMVFAQKGVLIAKSKLFVIRFFGHRISQIPQELLVSKVYGQANTFETCHCPTRCTSYATSF
jgi:hypothetical protein